MRTIVIGVDPGTTTAWAIIDIVDDKTLGVVCGYAECAANQEYSFRDRAVMRCRGNIMRWKLGENDAEFCLAIEGIGFQGKGSIMATEVIYTAYDIGGLFDMGLAYDMRPRIYRYSQHFARTTGLAVQKKSVPQVRQALSNGYGEEMFKKAKCTGDHKPMALSVATAYAMDLGLISW